MMNLDELEPYILQSGAVRIDNPPQSVEIGGVVGERLIVNTYSFPFVPVEHDKLLREAISELFIHLHATLIKHLPHGYTTFETFPVDWRNEDIEETRTYFGDGIHANFTRFNDGKREWYEVASAAGVVK